MHNIIGPRVRQARLSQRPKLTQSELSARLQSGGIPLTQAHISKIETGRRGVTEDELISIAEALKVSAAWLAAGGSSEQSGMAV